MSRSSAKIPSDYVLSAEATEAVKEIMSLGGFKTAEDALQRAFADSRSMLRHRAQGWQVLLAKPSRWFALGMRFKKVVWHDRLEQR
jgi:hypothetical protein